MTAADYTILDDLATDPGVLAAAKLRVIYGAIYKAATLAGGFYSAASVRPHLPEHLRSDPRIGAAVSALPRARISRPTGTYVPGMNAASRNAHRPVPVYRVRDWDALKDRTRP